MGSTSIDRFRPRSRAGLVALLAVAPAVPAADPPPCHTEAKPAAPPAAPPEARAGLRQERVAGLQIPDVAVRDQDGRELHFYRDLVAGKTVLMNFVFTTCTTICPPMGATFGKVQKLLGDRAGKDVHLISVSVDPTVDSPERLKAWGAQFGAGAGWTLVTGDREEIERLLKALAVYTPDKSSHSPLVLAGNDTSGRWSRAYGLARPEEMIALVDELAARKTAAMEGTP
jgi:protein SCO1/2